MKKSIIIVAALFLAGSAKAESQSTCNDEDIVLAKYECEIQVFNFKTHEILISEKGPLYIGNMYQEFIPYPIKAFGFWSRPTSNATPDTHVTLYLSSSIATSLQYAGDSVSAVTTEGSLVLSTVTGEHADSYEFAVSQAEVHKLTPQIVLEDTVLEQRNLAARVICDREEVICR